MARTLSPGHPCACRENSRGRFSRHYRLGPSLRVQGELRSWMPIHGDKRAIPARAGRTLRDCISNRGIPGHPCACRENGPIVGRRRGLYGPSLRVQGEPCARRSTSVGIRAIPARAGRTKICWYHHAQTTGHPCACRENQNTNYDITLLGGPSLRVQGELRYTTYYLTTTRAIPARAGRTLAKPRNGPALTGHPCACRENDKRRYWPANEHGPSLRVQGEPQPAVCFRTFLSHIL